MEGVSGGKMNKKLKALKARKKGEKLFEDMKKAVGQDLRYNRAFYLAWVKAYQYFLMNKRKGE